MKRYLAALSHVSSVLLTSLRVDYYDEKKGNINMAEFVAFCKTVLEVISIEAAVETTGSAPSVDAMAFALSGTHLQG